MSPDLKQAPKPSFGCLAILVPFLLTLAAIWGLS